MRASVSIQSGLDGIHFDDDIGSGAVINIDGNRLGYFAFSVGGPLTEERLADDGIEFSGEIKGNADINITDNYIRAKGDGVRFSDKIRDFANVLIGGLGDNNAINAWHNGVSFLNDITGQSLVEISYNGITASNDGIYFGDKIDNAKTTGGISEQELLIKNNTIWGRNNGIHFNGEIDGERHDTRIAGNDIEGEDGQGIVFDDDIDEAHVRIVENTRIEGEKDGIRFLGDIEDGARVNIDDNAKIEGKDEEAIHFFRKVADSFVSIFSNDDIRAGENGIEFNGEIDNSTIVISENNHGIHADDHGILFTNSIHSGSDIDIHDNIISANEDNGSTGDGIHFGGNIYTATINIGDGGGSSFGSDPSNFIRGKDGIHFEGSLNKGSQIVIDGNRIGYGKTSGGSTYEDRVDDDGIQFDGEIRGNADVKITDNYIKSDDDGISFRNNVKDDARILIGGRYDGNTIDADGEGDGIQFEDKIEDHSLIEISHNSIYADRNGVVFNDDTSNHLHSGHEEEILIAYNTIDGDENGILFEGRASHALHDIVIRDNYKIRGDGKGDHGISFTGGIDDAELTIKHNDEIYGAEDGIHITGQFFNDAKIRIHGNTDIKGDNDDAIEVNDYGSDWGLDLEIDHNHAHWSGDNGIYVRNIENADIHDNTVHDVDGNGIYGSHIDNGNIASNTIYNTGGNGILVNPTDHIDIAYNTIHDVDEDGIRVDDGHGADIWGNHIGRTGDDGIDVNDNDYVDIWDNYIHDTGRDSEHGDGISVDNSYRAEIKKNRITGAGRDGINVKDSNKTVIGWNKIFAEGGNYYYHDYGQEGAGRDGIHVENSDDLLVIGNDVTADLGYGHKGAIDRLGAGRHGIYVEGGKDIDIMYNHILGDSEHRRHYYNSVDSVGEDGIHVTAAEDILIKKNEVSRAGDDGIEVIVGNVEERREIRLGITSIRDRGRHEDDTNKVIIIGNEVSRSGDDGIVVTTEQDYDRREENKGPGVQSFGSQGGNDWDDNRSDGKKLFIKIADNDVEKSGDDGIEVNLKTSAGNNDNNNFPGPVGFLQQEEGFGGFGGHHDRPDNEILISDNNVSKSGDDGIVVKIAPKEEKNGNNEKPDEFFMQTSSGMDNNSGGIRNYVRIDGNKVFHSGDDGIQVDITTAAGSNDNGYPQSPAPRGLEQNEGFFGGFGGHHDRPDNEIVISDNLVIDSRDDGIVVKIAPKEERHNNGYGNPGKFAVQSLPGMDNSRGGINNYVKIDGNKVFHSGDDGIQVDITTDGGSNGYDYPQTTAFKGLGQSEGFFGGFGTQNKNTIIVSGNKVGFSGDDGIDISVKTEKDKERRGFQDNFMSLDYPGYSGSATTSNFIKVSHNDVFRSRDDGITIDVDNPRGERMYKGGYDDMYDSPLMTNSFGPDYGYGGYRGGNTNKVVIIGNDVRNSDDDGIQVVANKGSDVDLIMVRNTVRDSGDNGILLISKGGRHGGYYGGPQTEEKSLEPSVSLLSGYGYGGGHSHGGVFNSTLIDNIVENSGSNGLYVKGPHHGDVVLKGNTFINNPVGARFESGRIDVSDEERPNTFIVTPDYELPEGYKYVTGMQFDLAKKWKPTSLTIVGETLGTTAFYGFINRGVGTAYYVRFEDGAILDKYGNVIEIDGTRVDWDGFVPADNLDGDGNIPASVLAAIEARLFDADDPLLNGRGQIFVGTPAEESGATVAQEDIFNYFGPFRGTLSGLNVTIRGLPGIPGGPLSLNAITPFAGGEGEGEGGGTSPEDLNAIEAAAGGGESSPCLGDAVGIAETGQSVNVTYGTSPEETLAGAASCSSEL